MQTLLAKGDSPKFNKDPLTTLSEQFRKTKFASKHVQEDLMKARTSASMASIRHALYKLNKHVFSKQPKM